MAASRGVRAPALAAALAAAGLVVALHAHVLGARLWMDEGIALGIASHPLGAIPEALRQDGSPPLYYVLLHGWMAVFGSSETAVHALSLTCLALAVPAAAWAVWVPFGPAAGVLTGAVLALDPFSAWYADEARMYTLLLLLVALASGAFVRAFVLHRRRYVPVFAVLLAAVLYTHNWGLFYAAATVAVLAALVAAAPDRRALLRDGALAFGGAAVLYAPWLPTLIFQANHTGAPWSTPPPGGDLTGGVSWILSGTLPATLLLAVAAAGVLVMVRRGPPEQRRAVLALAAVAVLTLLLAFAWSHVSSPAWALRYLMVVLAALAPAIGAGLARTGVLGVAAVVAAFVLSWHGQPAKRELADKSNVAALAEAFGPRLPAGSLVVTTQPEQVPALRYYLGPARRYVTPLGPVRDPRVMDWRNATTRFGKARFDPVMAPLLRRLPPGALVLFVRPVHSHQPSPWARLVRRQGHIWAHALSRRLVTVATVTPKRGSTSSTLAGRLFTVRPAAPTPDQLRGAATARALPRTSE